MSEQTMDMAEAHDPDDDSVDQVGIPEAPDLPDVPDWDELEAAQEHGSERPSRRLPIVTGALVLAVALVVGFVAGVLVEKQSVPAASASGAAGSRRGAGGFGGDGFGGGGGGGGGGAVAGQVTLVDGPNVYVTDASGTTVKVATNAGTTITKAAPSTTGQIAPGDTVVARGQAASDGTVTAATVSDQGPGAATGGAGGAGAGMAPNAGG